MSFFLFFFNDTATTEIYTLSLHDALPICGTWRSSPFFYRRCPAGASSSPRHSSSWSPRCSSFRRRPCSAPSSPRCCARSEEHTSELQSLAYLVCRLLLEKKKIKPI